MSSAKVCNSSIILIFLLEIKYYECLFFVPCHSNFEILRITIIPVLFVIANLLANTLPFQRRSVSVFKVISEYPTISRKHNNVHYVSITLLFLKFSFKWQIKLHLTCLPALMFKLCKCADMNRLEESRFVEIMQRIELQLHVKQTFVTNSQ